MLDQQTLNNMNTIPIFDIMSVRGYSLYIEGVLRTFVFAQDIAREAGMTSETTYNYIGTTSGPKTYDHIKIRWDRFNHYANLSLPAIQQDTIDYYEDKVNELRYIIDTNKSTINYNIAFLQDLAEFGSIQELKDTIMSMTY